jgi:hypothetical protein
VFIRLISRFQKTKKKLLQQCLLENALVEIGLNPDELQIDIDHLEGQSKVNNIQLGIVYPRTFFSRAYKFTGTKTLEYYFNGFMPQEGGRREMLRHFAATKKTLIIESSSGRDWQTKGSFRPSYYKHFGCARFGLCPHQRDWKGPKDNLWTYRFVEACMCKSIPILFKETPLGEKFINGFKYFYDDEDAMYNEDWATANLELALHRFTLSSAQHAAILNTLKG